jgi:hypothetical protein
LPEKIFRRSSICQDDSVIELARTFHCTPWPQAGVVSEPA